MISRRFLLSAWLSATLLVPAMSFVVTGALAATPPARGALPANSSVPDGAGGAYLGWSGNENDPNETDVFLTRVDALGSPVWSPAVLLVCDAPDNQGGPVLVPDGSGGVYLVWSDSRVPGDSDVYAQRVSASGAIQWPANGVRLTLPGSSQFAPRLVSDGAGGVVVAWYDYRSGRSDLYAQRLGVSGTAHWTGGGVLVCASTGSLGLFEMTAVERGGTILTWSDPRSGPMRLYAQRLSLTGAPRWAVNGVLVAALPGPQEWPTISADGAGGAVIAWQHGLPPDLRAQRMDSTGTVLWGSGGMVLCDAPAQQMDPVIVSDGAEGAVVAWTDYRDSEYSVYVQRVSAGGSALWTPNGIQIADYTSQRPFVLPDGTGGAFLAWTDMRSDPSGDIYAQRVDGTGSLRWSAGSMPLCAAPSNQYMVALAGDGEGGAIAMWIDYRVGDADYYGQRVDSTGVAHWSTDGVPVAIFPGGQQRALLAADGSGGVFAGFFEKLGTQYLQRARRFAANGIPAWPTAPVSLQAHMKQPMLSVPDGSGGVIYAWHDRPAVEDVITVQRLAGDGSPLWGPNGVAVCADPATKEALSLAPDGTGGAIVAWTMISDPGPSGHVFAQRLDAGGALQWGACGLVLAPTTGDQYEPAVVSDGLGGAIVVWMDYRSGMARCHGQHLDASGTRLWTADGLPAVASELDPYELCASADGAGGIVLAWADSRSGAYNVAAQRLGPDGARRWGEDGLVLAAETEYQTSPSVASDGDSGAVVVWSDQRAIEPGIYAQRVSAAGSSLWNGSGVAVCTDPRGQGDARLVAMAGHETGIVWPDYRSDDHGDIYAQRLDGSGVAQWAINGVLVSDGTSSCDLPAVAGDGAAGLYVAWEQWALGGMAVRLSRIGSNGLIAPGWPGAGTTPALVSLVAADAEPDRVSIRWQVEGGAAGPVIVERRAGEETWAALSEVAPDGSGRVTYADRAVTSGARYGYRLVVSASGTRQAFGEVWVDVPLATKLALAGPAPSPAVGELAVTFALPDAQPASLQLWDVTGRRVRAHEVGQLGAGRHTLHLGSGRELSPGVYWVRLVRGGESLTARAVVVR